MKVKLKENKKIALIVAAVMILFSVLVLGGTKLRADRDEVQELFYEGVNRDSLGIYNDLQARLESAYNLITIANKYLPANSEEASNLLGARQSLIDAKTPSEMYNANHTLTVAVDTLYSELNNYEMDEEDKRLAAKQFAELSSRNQTISHDLFNAEASHFNSTMGTFPAWLVAAVNGIEPVDLYR